MVRKITTTSVNSSNVKLVEGKPVVTENEVLLLDGEVKEMEATRTVRKKFGDYAQVTELTTVTDTYEMDLATFIKYATKKEDK